MSQRPHAVCLPMAAQGHINPMLSLAKLLHSHSFFITFVYTDFDHARLLRSSGPDAIRGSSDFQFATIPDGLWMSDESCGTGSRHIASLCDSLQRNCLVPFRNLLTKLNGNSSEDRPQVSLVVWDGLMSFGRQAAEDLGIGDLMFWTSSACSLMGMLHYPQLIEKGITPLKDESYLTNGFLETQVDWIPGMENICLRDLPSLFKTTKVDDILFNFATKETQNSLKASGIIFNTFEELEHNIMAALTKILPLPTYTIGPLSLLWKQIPKPCSISSASNLWKEDPRCIEWLDQRDPQSVVYINFGSIINMSIEQVIELAWGLANSNYYFLWVIRSDLTTDGNVALPQDLMRAIEGRSLLVGWCPQEQVLNHPSIGTFFTHCGWNSVLEGICYGVPMICWPFFADQPTNCHYMCKKWGIGVEIGDEVRKEVIESVIREVIEGVKGKEMRQKAVEWKVKANMAVKEGGSSYSNMNKLFEYLKC